MKKRYRIVKEWKTRYNPITNQNDVVEGPKWYIEYRTLATILFSETGWDRLSIFSAFDSEVDALDELATILKKQEKTKTHKEVVFESYQKGKTKQ